MTDENPVENSSLLCFYCCYYYCCYSYYYYCAATAIPLLLLLLCYYCCTTAATATAAAASTAAAAAAATAYVVLYLACAFPLAASAFRCMLLPSAVSIRLDGPRLNHHKRLCLFNWLFIEWSCWHARVCTCKRQFIVSLATTATAAAVQHNRSRFN